MRRENWLILVEITVLRGKTDREKQTGDEAKSPRLPSSSQAVSYFLSRLPVLTVLQASARR
jgi:hypothetical protein